MGGSHRGVHRMMTMLCLASYDKGHEFLREAKRQGSKVVLLTSESIRQSVHFPTESIDEIFYMADEDHRWNLAHTLNAVAYLARTREFDRIVPLDDFDVEVAAMLREHLRVPGMGETTAHYFRDKLAMRMRAAEAGIRVPDFVHVLNHGRIAAFLERVPGPWVLKPRSMAGAIGIRKVHDAKELWEIVEALGDEQCRYVLERFVPGDIFHVDSIVYEKEIRFAIASGYGKPPLEVAHGGGIFTTRILERGSETAHRLLAENQRVLAGLGLLRGVSHTEYIIGRDDNQVYFLETSARVGGAHIADLVEAATGINLWGGVGQSGGDRRSLSLRAAAAARRLRRAGGFSGAAGAPRHIAIRRSGGGVEDGQIAPCRPDRSLRRPRACTRPTGGLHQPHRARLSRRRAAPSTTTALNLSLPAAWLTSSGVHCPVVIAAGGARIQQKQRRRYRLENRRRYETVGSSGCGHRPVIVSHR
jgi:hypothetical protein